MEAVSKPKETLSDTCTICHQPRKYRCPSCRAPICSVQCSKKHKRRTLCTGERDPGVYLSRSQLSTDMQALDRDFGFITGVERGFEKAEKVWEDSEGRFLRMKRQMRGTENEYDRKKRRREKSERRQKRLWTKVDRSKAARNQVEGKKSEEVEDGEVETGAGQYTEDKTAVKGASGPGEMAAD